MKIKILLRWFSIVFALTVMQSWLSAPLLCMQSLAQYFVQGQDFAQNIGWLGVPEYKVNDQTGKEWNDGVLIRITDGGGIPAINPKTGACNFWYVEPSFLQQPLITGLYTWSSDYHNAWVNQDTPQGPARTYVISRLPQSMGPRKTYTWRIDANGYYSYHLVEKKWYGYFDSSKWKPESFHPSPSLWGLLKPLPSGNPVVPSTNPRIDFFKYLMGKYEAEWVQDNVIGKDILSIKKTISDALTAKGYGTGFFQELTIQELRNQTDNADPFKGQKAQFDLIVSSDKKTIPLGVDIAALQADPANKDAIFMIASRFHALEKNANQTWYLGGGNGPLLSALGPNLNTFWGSVSVAYKYGGFPSLLEAFYKGTQGECAAQSAAPAAIWRMYGQPPFNMVHNLGLGLTPIGMIAYDQNSIIPKDFLNGGFDEKEVALKNAQVMATNLSSYQDLKHGSIKDILIGVHTDASVAYGRSQGSDPLNADDELAQPGQVITQIFVAALDFATGKTQKRFDINNPSHAALGKMLLYASFEGTIRTAVLRGMKSKPGARKVYLTMLGAGVFDNPKNWLVEAIDEMKDFIKEKNLHIIMNCYTEWQGSDFFKALSGTVQEIGGTITVYDAGNNPTEQSFLGTMPTPFKKNIHPNTKKDGDFSNKLVGLKNVLTKLTTSLDSLKQKLNVLKNSLK